MSDVVYRGSEDSTPSETAEAPVVSKAEWLKNARESVGQEDADDSPLTVAEASAEQVRKRREREAGSVVIERKYSGDAKDAISLREAADDLSWTRALEQGQSYLNVGFTPDEARTLVATPEVPDEYVVHEPGEELSVREAATRVGQYRQAANAQRAAQLEAIAGALDERRAQQAAVEQPPQQPEQHQPEQVDPAVQERQAIAAERNAVEAVKRMSAGEYMAAAQLNQISAAAQREFPDLRTAADIEALRVQNPRRFARLAQLDRAAAQTR